MTMEAGFAILAWNVLIIDDEPIPCYAPVISPEGDVVQASNHLWCVLFQRWVHSSGTINHHTRHVRIHAEQREEIKQLTDSSGIPLALISYFLQGGEVYTALEFFRGLPAGQWLPSQKQLG
jgi:hypothetical protein